MHTQHTPAGPGACALCHISTCPLPPPLMSHLHLAHQLRRAPIHHGQVAAPPPQQHVAPVAGKVNLQQQGEEEGAAQWVVRQRLGVHADVLRSSRSAA